MKTFWLGAAWILLLGGSNVSAQWTNPTSPGDTNPPANFYMDPPRTSSVMVSSGTLLKYSGTNLSTAVLSTGFGWDGTNLTVTASGSATDVEWTDVTGKPFTNYTDFTTNTLSAIDWAAILAWSTQVWSAAQYPLALTNPAAFDAAGTAAGLLAVHDTNTASHAGLYDTAGSSAGVAATIPTSSVAYATSAGTAAAGWPITWPWSAITNPPAGFYPSNTASVTWSPVSTNAFGTVTWQATATATGGSTTNAWEIPATLTDQSGDISLNCATAGLWNISFTNSITVTITNGYDTTLGWPMTIRAVRPANTNAYTVGFATNLFASPGGITNYTTVGVSSGVDIFDFIWTGSRFELRNRVTGVKTP